MRLCVNSKAMQVKVQREKESCNGTIVTKMEQWKKIVTLGYITGTIPKPGPESVLLPTSETTPIQPVSTPIYSSRPTLDEWIFCDQLARGHITLNCTDVVSLGVTMTGTAKEAWDSIQMEWGKSTDMHWSHAQEASTLHCPTDSCGLLDVTSCHMEVTSRSLQDSSRLSRTLATK